MSLTNGSDRTTPKPSRGAAGSAGGALSGRYPDPGPGTPGLCGWGWEDDFVAPIDKTTQSGNWWKYNAILGGATPTNAVADLSATPFSARELGVLAFTTFGGVADGGVLYQANAALLGGVPVGTTWVAKVWLDSTTMTQIGVSCGFCSSKTVIPIVGAAQSFVGVRAVSGGAASNWYGVVKNGAGAGNETTVDLGVLADGTPRIVAFQRTSSGIQFYVIDATDTLVGPCWSAVGSEATTAGAAALPTATLWPAFGLYGAVAATQKTMYIDLFSVGGCMAR